MLDVLLIIITLIILCLASYSDIKTREIPDWLNFSLIAAAFGLRTIAAIDQGLFILLSGIIGFVLCFGLALLFYYSNQWGGGDSKLLMGMGAVLGVSWPLSKSSFTLLWFLLSLLFLGMLWGLAWMTVVAIKRKHLFILRFKHVLSEYKILHWILLALTVILALLMIYHHRLWPLVLFPLIIFYIFMFVNSVEKSCFYTRKTPTELTEGDWLAEDIMVNQKKVMFKKTLNKKDLVYLLGLKNRKKLNTVVIKEGIPFIPSFLFSYIFVVFFEKYIYEFLRMVF